MAVFYVNIRKDNGQLRKILPSGDFDLADFYRCVEAFICFLNEFLKNVIFEKKDNSNEANR